MACSGELLPPAKRCRPTSFPVQSLPFDVEINVLQRLSSHAALASAASTCHRWRNLISDSVFERRFRTTHPPPVLGLFFNPSRHVIPGIPSFAPVRRDDDELAKLILKGDFLLTPLYVNPQIDPTYWHVVDSRSGRLLLFNYNALQIALLNPMKRKLEGYFNLMKLDLADGAGPEDQFLEPRLICGDEIPSNFWIFFLRHNDRRVQVAMFNHIWREGLVLPWLDAPARPNPDDDRDDWLEDGMVSGAYIYWFYKNYRHVIILDLTTIELRCYAQEIPPSFYGQGDRYYVLGSDFDANEDPDSSLPTIVYAAGNTVFRLTGGAPGNLEVAWVSEVVKDLGPDMERMFADLNMPLPQGDNHLAISGLRDGFIFFTTSHLGRNAITWFCSLNLETGQVERLLWGFYDAKFQPYYMPWPCSLFRDEYDNDVAAEGPSDCSKGNTDRGQDGQTSSQQMEDIAPDPTSEQQSPKQPTLLLFF